jgi:alpha-aminoadipic semialdehyde synthase
MKESIKGCVHSNRLNVYGSNPILFCTGFSEIMGTLARIGFFSTETHPILEGEKRPTFRTLLHELLKIKSEEMDGPLIAEKVITERIVSLRHCKEQRTAVKAAKTIM